MKNYLFFGLLLGLGCFVLSCETEEMANHDYPYPMDNPPETSKISLGKSLFFDKRLSVDGSIACADCHLPQFAFTDRKKVSSGIFGQHTERNAPSILNSAFLQTVMFDAHLKSLEMQVIVPIQEPTEMGHNMKTLIPKLREIPEYQAAAQKIFNRDFDAWVLTRSIAAFERSLISLNSPYDLYMKGQKNAMSKDALAGKALFDNTLNCKSCHPAPYFTTFKAENNGLYAVYGKDKGRFRIDLDSSEIGFYKIPSLRNIALTYPYMHDGSLNSLTDVLKHYMEGGKHPKGQSAEVKSFSLSITEQKQIIAFLNALTDTSYLKNFNSK